MDKTHSLQALLNNTATEEDITLLKRLLASGEISIGGNVNQSVIIIGSGNTVELPPAALDRLNARPMLGNLDRDLTGEEIAAGLRRLDKLLPNRAPVLLPHYKEQVGRLRPTLKTEIKSLSESSRRERIEALAAINSICVEAVDISFNGLCLGEEAPRYDARSPFRGLESFRPEDSEFFFGREALTRKLVAQIQAHPFLAVLGASGSGKSSLVMAGVIPALDSDYAIFRPGTNPLDELESARGKSLIVVDQFEELFTLTRDESTRKDFIARLLDESARARIILTLRSDFLGEVGAYRTLSAEIQSHLEIIPPMDMDELRRAMEGQAGMVGLRFEADLSQQILDDVAGEPGAMPLLQHALWELWNRRHGRNLRASEYRAFGGVKQAITSTAEKVYADCSKPEQDQVRDIFLRLTRLDDSDEGRDTRRRVPLGDLIPSGRDAASITLFLDKLANARLIVKAVNESKTEIEVAHEALIRHWERLRLWLNEDRDNLRLRESVSEDTRRWENAGRDNSMLNHRGGRLDDALALRGNSNYGLTIIEQTYLNACLASRNKEQHEREQRLRRILIASVAIAMIFLVLGSYGWVKSNEATNQAKMALSRQLAAQAQTINATRKSRQMIAVLLAIQSMKMFPSSEAAQILINNNFTAHSIARMPHGYPVNSVAFSPDGKHVVSGSIDNTARVWEASTGREVARMTHDGVVWSVAFSPDGKYVISGSEDNTVRVWEASTGMEVARMTHDSWVISVALSLDGRYVVSGSGDNTSRVWETSTGKEVARMTHNGVVRSVAFSPDGNYVASGSEDNTVRVWETYTGKEVARMAHDGVVWSVAFSPDGRYVVSGSHDNTARVWETSTGKEVARMPHYNSVRSVAFSPDSSYVVSGSWDSTARVWEAVSGQEVARMTHDSSVSSVAFSPDGKYVVSGSIDNTARVWETSTSQEVARMTHDSYLNSVTFSPDGKHVVSGSDDNTARVWETSIEKEVVLLSHDGVVWSVDFSPNGRYVVSGSDDNTARVWDAATGKEVAHMILDDSVVIVRFSPDSQYVVSGSWDNTVRVWEASTGKEVARMSHDAAVWSVAFSPDGKYVVSGSEDNTVRVWEASTGKEVARMLHNYPVSSVAFSPDGKYVISGSEDNTVRVWGAPTGKEVARMSHDAAVWSVAFSPDGKYVASGSEDNTVRVWETSTGKEVARMSHDAAVWSVAFSPDGKYVVSGSLDNTARMWGAVVGNEIVRMTHYGAVRSVTFSPDGKYVMSGSFDNTARIWEATTGKEVAQMIHNDSSFSVAFSPDGKHVVSGSDDNTARIWVWQSDDLIVNACAFLPRNLTRTEWKQYIGDSLPYQAVCPNLPSEAESTQVP